MSLSSRISDDRRRSGRNVSPNFDGSLTRPVAHSPIAKSLVLLPNKMVSKRPVISMARRYTRRQYAGMKFNICASVACLVAVAASAQEFCPTNAVFLALEDQVRGYPLRANGPTTPCQVLVGQKTTL